LVTDANVVEAGMYVLERALTKRDVVVAINMQTRARAYSHVFGYQQQLKASALWPNALLFEPVVLSPLRAYL